MDVIGQLAQSLRRRVEEKQQGYSHAVQQMEALVAHLSRCDGSWRLELNDEAQIPGDVAHTWARACGAPDGTPVLFSCGGRVHLAVWGE